MILPLSLSGKIITNFKEKANLFNKCFSMKSFTKWQIKNQTYITETKVSSFNIEDEDIYKILDINKAHEHDEVSIRMLELCGTVFKKFSIIFKICNLISGKKTNFVPIHRKGEKDLIKKLLSSFFLTAIWKHF